MDKFRQTLVEDYRRTYREAMREVCRRRFMTGKYILEKNHHHQEMQQYLAVARNARQALRDMGERL